MYINYTTTGQLVLPMDIEVRIPEHHLWPIVDLAVEKMNPTILSSFHPGGYPRFEHKNSATLTKNK